MGRKKAEKGTARAPHGDELLRILHSPATHGKLRTLVKSGMDPNCSVETACFDSTTWILPGVAKPCIPLLVFACFNGVPAATVELLIKLGANPNSVTDCGLPCPLAVLCAKITPEEQRALFQVRPSRARCTHSLIAVGGRFCVGAGCNRLGWRAVMLSTACTGFQTSGGPHDATAWYARFVPEGMWAGRDVHRPLRRQS